jgi:hypothetical protein
VAEPFILDLESNPHPRLLNNAIRTYMLRDDWPSFFLGYIKACADATGCSEQQIIRWIKHHLPAEVPPNIYPDEDVESDSREVSPSST